MKKPTGLHKITNSVQLKFSVTFLLLIAGLLVLLNTYPTIVSRDMVFTSKQAAMQNQAGVISSALSVADELSADTVAEIMGLLDLRSMTRVVVTDDNALILYDTAKLDPAVGRYALFSEISRALQGKLVFRSSYDGRAFMSHQSMPIRSGGVSIGAVYLYQYDSQQALLISGIQSNLRKITLIMGIAALILMFIFSRRLTNRVTELAKATKIVSEGDYDYRINIRGNDELSELGEEFNLLTQRLKYTEELRRRFVSDASHELKTPLASIRLLSDSIVNSENMDMDTMREFVSDIGNEAERLGRTTEKLMSLTKMDSRVELDKKPLFLKPLVEKTIHLLSPLAGENKIKITSNLVPSCKILGNEDLLLRIIFNLVENAIKYNLPGGWVNLLLFRQDNHVLLVVEDTGIGIPDEDLPNIFSRFYRVDKARSRDAGGSGLGLSIVYDAVALHGGKIDVEKRSNHGTRFTVSFPVIGAEEGEE